MQMIKPTRGTLKLISKTKLSSKATGVTFEVIEPEGFLFTPGSFLTINLGGSTFRAYSISSDVKKLPCVSFAIETAHDGAGSNYVKNMEIGETCKFIGPSGKMHLPEKLPPKMYFFATGTGIAPFISIFYELERLKYAGQVNLLFGVRKEHEIFFTEELGKFLQNIKHFNYKVFISRPENTSNIAARITSILPKMKDRSALYFICGHPSMVDEVEKGLKENGISAENIIKELFSRPTQTDKV
jgi:ferredoxin-NADP reductase